MHLPWLHLAHMSELYQPLRHNASHLSLVLNFFWMQPCMLGIGAFPTSQILYMKRIILAFEWKVNDEFLQYLCCLSQSIHHYCALQVVIVHEIVYPGLFVTSGEPSLGHSQLFLSCNSALFTLQLIVWGSLGSTIFNSTVPISAEETTNCLKSSLMINSQHDRRPSYLMPLPMKQYACILLKHTEWLCMKAAYEHFQPDSNQDNA